VVAVVMAGVVEAMLTATVEEEEDTAVVVEEAMAAVLVVIACLTSVLDFKSKAGVSPRLRIINIRD
jgi:hypothetical protein